MAVQTLVDLFDTAVKERPRKDMFQYKEEGRWIPVSSEEASSAVNELAAGLAELGIQAGDRVAILSNNRLEWILADQAILRLGAVVVTIYPTLEHVRSSAKTPRNRRSLRASRPIARTWKT